MNSLSVTVPNSFAITINPEIESQKQTALESAGAIFVVDSVEDQAEATRAIQSIKRITKEVEAARKACKAELEKPIKLLDQTAKDFTKELIDEENRLTGMNNAYHAATLAKQREEERKRQEEIRRQQIEADLARMEAEKAARQAREAEASFLTEQEEQAAMAQAEEAARKAQEAQRAAEQAQAAPLVKVPEKAAGASVTEKPMFEVVNIHDLYKFNPEFVRLEANAMQINRALSSGAREIPGLRIWVEVKTSYRS